jgi:hypothetical protein
VRGIYAYFKKKNPWSGQNVPPLNGP